MSQQRSYFLSHVRRWRSRLLQPGAERSVLPPPPPPAQARAQLRPPPEGSSGSQRGRQGLLTSTRCLRGSRFPADQGQSSPPSRRTRPRPHRSPAPRAHFSFLLAWGAAASIKGFGVGSRPRRLRGDRPGTRVPRGPLGAGTSRPHSRRPAHPQGTKSSSARGL